MEEFTPLNAQIVNESLVVTHTGTVFKTEINDIQSIELLETLPRYHKIVGSGMENLLKGKFRITGWYECRLYLNPQKKPFLKLVLNDESIVIVGSSDGNIENIYRQLLSEVKQE